MLIDSHVHLQHPSFDGNREALLNAARQSGISGWIVPAVSKNCWPRIAELTANNRDCFGCYGIHPSQLSHTDCANLTKNITPYLNSAVAIGEIGLDGACPDHHGQVHLLRMQLAIARSLNLPLMLHLHKATAALIQVLRDERWNEMRGIVHGFTGSHETASQLLRLGMIISLGHRIVPDNSCRIRTMVQNLPDSSFVFETDAPQHDTSINNQNLPQLLRLHTVIKRASELRQEDPPTLIQESATTVCQIFPAIAHHLSVDTYYGTVVPKETV